MKIVYESFDGKYFNSESACEAYEEECGLEELKKRIVAFDSVNKRVEANTTGNFLYQMNSFRIDDEETLNLLLAVFNRAGDATDGIDDIGMYVWDSRDSYWSNLTERLEDLKAQVYETEELIDILQNA